MKTLFRAFGLVAALALVGLAAANGQAPLGTCRNLCKNDSTGKLITWPSQATQETCCEGFDPSACPTGYSFDGDTTWNREGCP